MLPNKLNVPGKQIMSQHAKEKTKNRNTTGNRSFAECPKPSAKT
jgi:hypothetical protein